MKFTRNQKLDVGYLELRKGKVHRTIKVRKGILIDLDRNGQVLGIEVLSLSVLSTDLPSRKSKKAA